MGSRTLVRPQIVIRVPGARVRRRRVGIAVALLSIVALAIGGWLAVARHGDGLPDEIGDVPRLTSAQGRTFDGLLDGSMVAGLRVHGAAYGHGEPELVLFFYVDPPPGLQDRSLASLVGALPASGGSIDPSSAQTKTVDGVEYLCASGPASSGPIGVSCLFRGDVVGGLAVLTPLDPAAALDLAREAYVGIRP